MPPRVLIYEDHHSLRAGIRALLELSGAFTVAGAYADGTGVAEQVAATQPDLIIMDIDMPGRNGIDSIALAKAACPEVRIMMFTVFDDEEKIFRAITAGADGYLLKKAPPEKIIEALQDLSRGESPMTPAIARKVLSHFAAHRPAQKQYELTAKETEVLRFLTQGLSMKLIAAEAGISIETVRSHMKHIYAKLHVNSSTQAVSKALLERLV